MADGKEDFFRFIDKFCTFRQWKIGKIHIISDLKVLNIILYGFRYLHRKNKHFYFMDYLLEDTASFDTLTIFLVERLNRNVDRYLMPLDKLEEINMKYFIRKEILLDITHKAK